MDKNSMTYEEWVARNEVKAWDDGVIDQYIMPAIRTENTPPPTEGLPTDDAARKALPLWTFLTEYFPDAILAMVEVSVAGNNQHNPGQPLHWARQKSKDQFNTAARHLWDHSRGATRDTDGQYHLAKAAWRICAALQLQIEQDRECK